jgi:hypothetical protein
MTDLDWKASIEAPERESSVRPEVGPAWIVTVYDNDVNTYEEVMTVLMLATCCTAEEAYIEAWEIDHYGHCVVHRADEEECKGVAEVVATIGIRVEATPEA